MSLGATVAMQDASEKDDALESLLVDYNETLLGLREQLASQHKFGTLQYHEMLRAENELIDEELEILTKTEDRIAALEKRLQNCVILENWVAARVEVNNAAAAEMLKEKSQRLMVQIKLKREKLQK